TCSPSVTCRMLWRSPASSSSPSGVNGVVIAVHTPWNCARAAAFASAFRYSIAAPFRAARVPPPHPVYGRCLLRPACCALLAAPVPLHRRRARLALHHALPRHAPQQHVHQPVADVVVRELPVVVLAMGRAALLGRKHLQLLHRGAGRRVELAPAR